MFNKMNLRNFTIAALAFLTVACFFPFETAHAQKKKKMKPDELVGRHLEALGPAEIRTSDRSRIAIGNSELRLVAGGRGQSQGSAVFASKEETSLIDVNFVESPEFPFERINYDGKELEVKQYKPGSRSPIGQFLISYDEVFKEGLFGGTLSTAWALLRLDENRPKLKFKGTKEVGGKEAYQLQYNPRKGSDLDIRLYFDAETFQHIRTEYKRTVAAQMGVNTRDSISQRETRYTLVENFSDFTEVGGLTLPKTYQIQYSIFARNTAIEIHWDFNFSQFAFNQPFSLKEEPDTP